MYTIYSDTLGQHVCLHDDTISNTAVKVIEPVLTLEENAAGSLTFRLAQGNVGYDTSEITVTEVATVTLNGNYKGEVNTVSDLNNITDPQENDIWGVLADNTKHKYVSGEWEICEETSTTREVTKTFDLVGRMSSIIKVYKNDKEIWEGRVLTEDQDFFNCRKIYCEGELSYLNDTCQPARNYFNVTLEAFYEAVLNYHNQKVDASKQFKKGIITVTVSDPETGAPDSNINRYTQYEKTMETINKLVEEFGGHLRIRKENGVRYLDYLKDYPGHSTQVIRFGKNLLDFTRSYDMSSLCTAVLPTGAVIEEEKSSKVGPEVQLYQYPTPSGTDIKGQSSCYILNQNNAQSGVYYTYNPACRGYHTARAVVTPGKTYYVSCRLHGGYVMYCLRSNADGTGDYHSEGIKKASTNIGFTDCVETKIEVPANFNSIILCGFGDDIPIRVNEAIEETPSGEESELEKYTVLDEYDDTPYHQKGSLYVVNPEAVSQYGWIEKRLDMSDIEDVDALYNAALKYLTSGQFDEMTIELSAVDMNLLGVESDDIDILDTVWVVSEPHGLEKLFPVTKLEIPLDNPADMKFTLGSKTEQTLTEVNNDVKDDLLSKIAGLPSYNKTLDAAKDNAAQLIGSATGGYITLVKNEEGTGTAEIVISDDPDLSHATNVWVWNQNGLCHSDKYPVNQQGAHVNNAMTMDGQLIADIITAGTLRAIDIYGCQIQVGGDSGTPGWFKAEPNVVPEYGKGAYIEIRDGQLLGGYRQNNGGGSITSVQTVRIAGANQMGAKVGLGIDAPEVFTICTPDFGIGPSSTTITQTANINKLSNNPNNIYGNCMLCFMDQSGNVSGHACCIVHGMIVPLWGSNPPPHW